MALSPDPSPRLVSPLQLCVHVSGPEAHGVGHQQWQRHDVGHGAEGAHVGTFTPRREGGGAGVQLHVGAGISRSGRAGHTSVCGHREAGMGASAGADGRVTLVSVDTGKQVGAPEDWFPYTSINKFFYILLNFKHHFWV